jgi:MFS transporter, DHA1 family, multidrug resistance protein
LLIFVGFLNYITDSYLMYAASALAANTVARSAAGAAAPLFTDYMFKALGVGGGGSLIGGVAVLLAPIPFIFYHYGRPIRERSKFAPTKPKQPDQKQDEEASPERRGSDSDVQDELALDEEMGVLPENSDVEKELDKDKVSRTPSPQRGLDGDRFLDASGMEKAEHTPA